jgi:hypothetical protein
VRFVIEHHFGVRLVRVNNATGVVYGIMKSPGPIPKQLRGGSNE